MLLKCSLCGGNEFIQLHSKTTAFLPEIIGKDNSGPVQQNVCIEHHACKNCGCIISLLDDKSLEKAKAFPNIVY